jgi:hypothetical protein
MPDDGSKRRCNLAPFEGWFAQRGRRAIELTRNALARSPCAPDGVCFLVRPRRATIFANICNDDRAVADLELGPMTLTDACSLDKSESWAEPNDRRAHIRVCQNWHDRRGMERLRFMSG